MTSAPAINTDAGWIAALLQTADTFYPTGAYAHSFGLEGLVQLDAVRDRAGLRDFLLTSVVPTLRHTELPLAAHAWRAFGEPADWATVAALARLASATKVPREARAASEAIGRQRADLLASLRAHPLAVEYAQRAAADGWPHATALAAALEARVLGAPLDAALAGLFYAGVAGPISAAMKLLRLGQQGAQSLLTEVLMLASASIACASGVALRDIGWSNPWLDIASARHESADFRLFIS